MKKVHIFKVKPVTINTTLVDSYLLTLKYIMFYSSSKYPLFH